MLAVACLIALLSIFNVLNALPLPVAPNNIVCFPERDFCTVEGFLTYTGQNLILRATRGTTVIGGAVGLVSGGDVAFEVNHPGAYCWGADMGPTLQVTPDLLPGDVMSISSGNFYVADMTIQDGRITDVQWNGANVITVTGNAAAVIDRANMELRVVQPDFSDTAIGRRDVRAIVGPVAAEAGYTSQIVFNGNNFVATFTFDNAELATLCNAGSFSLSMWQLTDAAGNGQGITISEFGEVGGPFSTGCPAAAESVDPVLPTDIVVAGNTLKWNPAVTIAGTVPFTGYQVEVVKAGTVPQQVFAYRLDAATTQVTFTTTTVAAGDVLGVRTFQGAKTSDAYTETYAPITNTLATTLGTNPAGNTATATAVTSIVFSTSSTNVQIVYTISATSGVEPYNTATSTPNANAVVYDLGSAIPITGAVFVKAVAFNSAGLVLGSTGFLRFTTLTTIPPAPLAAAPTAAVGSGSIVATWAAPADTSVAGYEVQVFSGATLVLTATASTNAFSFTTGTTGTLYKFAVKTFNAANVFSAASAFSNAVVFPTIPDTITITSARLVTGKEFRVRGTGTVNGAVVTAYRATATGALGTSLGLSAAVGACVAGVCTYQIRVTNNLPTGVSSIFVLSDKGGRAGPFAL